GGQAGEEGGGARRARRRLPVQEEQDRARQGVGPPGGQKQGGREGGGRGTSPGGEEQHPGDGLARQGSADPEDRRRPRVELGPRGVPERDAGDAGRDRRGRGGDGVRGRVRVVRREGHGHRSAGTRAAQRGQGVLGRGGEEFPQARDRGPGRRAAGEGDGRQAGREAGRAAEER